jgi:hypothetical protein
VISWYCQKIKLIKHIRGTESILSGIMGAEKYFLLLSGKFKRTSNVG